MRDCWNTGSLNHAFNMLNDIIFSGKPVGESSKPLHKKSPINQDCYLVDHHSFLI